MTRSLRILESDIGPVVPVIDITNEIGYSRSAATRLIERHRGSFAGLTVTLSTKTRAGRRPATCLTRKGIEEFIRFMAPDQTHYPELYERVRKFKEKMFGSGGPDLKALQPALPPAPDPINDVLTRYADRADVLINRWGYKPEVARNICMGAAVDECPALVTYRGPTLIETGDKPNDAIPALPAPALESPKADPEYDRHFSKRRLAKMCQCSENDVLKILEDEGILKFLNQKWHLTRLGERYGRVFPVCPEWPHRTYSELRIRYNDQAVQLVRGKLFGVQTPLATFQRAPVVPGA